MRGETIGDSRSGYPGMCPVRCIVCRIIHLYLYIVLTNTLLVTSHNATGSTFNLKPLNITMSLKQALTCFAPTLGFLASDVSDRSLRADVANALLGIGMDANLVRLLD